MERYTDIWESWMYRALDERLEIGKGNLDFGDENGIEMTSLH